MIATNVICKTVTAQTSLRFIVRQNDVNTVSYFLVWRLYCLIRSTANGGDCMCEGETTQRRLCAVVRRCVVSTDRVQAANVPGNEWSRERKFYHSNECSRERVVLRTNISDTHSFTTACVSSFQSFSYNSDIFRTRRRIFISPK